MSHPVSTSKIEHVASLGEGVTGWMRNVPNAVFSHTVLRAALLAGFAFSCITWLRLKHSGKMK